jgi:hypothetical protein
MTRRKWHTIQYNGYKCSEDYEKKSKPIDHSHLLWICGFKDCKYDVYKIYDMLEMIEKDIKDRILINEKYKKFSLPFSSKLSNLLSGRSSTLPFMSLPLESSTKITLPSWCLDLKRPNECVQLKGTFWLG